MAPRAPFHFDPEGDYERRRQASRTRVNVVRLMAFPLFLVVVFIGYWIASSLSGVWRPFAFAGLGMAALAVIFLILRPWRPPQ